MSIERRDELVKAHAIDLQEVELIGLGFGHALVLLFEVGHEALGGFSSLSSSKSPHMPVPDASDSLEASVSFGMTFP